MSESHERGSPSSVDRTGPGGSAGGADGAASAGGADGVASVDVTDGAASAGGTGGVVSARRFCTVAVVAVLLCLVGLAVTATVGTAVDSGADSGPEVGTETTDIGTTLAQQTGGETTLPQQGDIAAALAQDIDADSVVLGADIREDGSADWRVTYRLTLDSEERETAFEELQADIDEDPSAYLDPFDERMRTTAAEASEATGREMTVDGFTVETERESQPQGEFGLVTFRFEWTGFAAADGDTIRAGDALDRLILGDEESLQLSWPAGYSLQSSSPEPETIEEGRVVWRGPIDFDAGQPRIELAADDEPSTALGLLALAAVGFIVAAAVVLWRRRRAREGTTAPDPAATESAGEAEPDAGGNEAAAGDTAGAETAATDTEPEGPPPELLSNEEQVIQLLEANGGRMKQQAVAEQLDWTAAKTSQVVSDLREEDAIESFRLGRENVLTLPDVDLMGAGDEDSDERE